MNICMYIRMYVCIYLILCRSSFSISTHTHTLSEHPAAPSRRSMAALIYRPKHVTPYIFVLARTTHGTQLGSVVFATVCLVYPTILFPLHHTPLLPIIFILSCLLQCYPLDNVLTVLRNFNLVSIFLC